MVDYAPIPPGAPVPPPTPFAPAPAPAAAPVFAIPSNCPPPWWLHRPPKSLGMRILTYFFVVLFIVSVVVNIELAALSFAGKVHMDTTVLHDGNKRSVVAVYDITGMIGSNTAADFRTFYRTVRDTDDIKAVVLRVETGGGGVSASDEINRLVLAIRRDLKKPVVVSMGAVAASGGYYVSAPASEIYAEPTTITGSIGVIAILPVIKGMLDKIGVDVFTIRSTSARQWKARENYWEVPDAQTLGEMQNMLDQMQARFDSVVKDGRGERLRLDVAATMPASPVALGEAPAKPTTTTRPAKMTSAPSGPAPFNGKVYLADDALKIGLIDEIGYLSDAWERAAALAKLADPKVVQYRATVSLREKLGFGDGDASIKTELIENLSAPRILLLWKPM